MRTINLLRIPIDAWRDITQPAIGVTGDPTLWPEYHFVDKRHIALQPSVRGRAHPTSPGSPSARVVE